MRIFGMLLAEQHDEWAVARRYMGGESLAAVTVPRAELEATDDEAAEYEEVMPVLVAAAG